MSYLELKSVSKVFPGNITALRNFSLHIEQGELIAVVGPSGCGKSTLLRLISGLEEITSGDILLKSTKINDIPPHRRNIAMMFQNYVLFPHLTIFDNMAFGLKIRGEDRQRIKSQVRSTARMLNIENLLDRFPNSVSGGQRQRAALGRAILRNPDVFLMDEPLSNLDARMRTQMRVEINQLHRQMKSTMIFVTHDQTEAMTLGDRIVVLRDGTIQQIAPPAGLYASPANRFVAEFIGSPGMNFFKGDLVLQNGALCFFHPLFQAPIRPEMEQRLKNFIGKSISAGIRPEDFSLCKGNGTSDSSDCCQISAGINIVEQMGSHSLVHIKDNGCSFSARIESSPGLKAGDNIEIIINCKKMTFFDPVSEKSI